MIRQFKAEQTGLGFDFDVTLTPDKRMYCFIGKNGIGKTQLLENIDKEQQKKVKLMFLDLAKTLQEEK